MTMKASVDTGYLRVGTMGYMPPPNGTQFKSLTGIVSTDYKGYIWPRSDADLVK